MTHTQAFAEHVARRAATYRVTWRRVSEDTGGGYSGLGPGGQLVYVRWVGPANRHGEWEYGWIREGGTRERRGSCRLLIEAKLDAERMFVPATPPQGRQSTTAVAAVSPSCELRDSNRRRAGTPTERPQSRDARQPKGAPPVSAATASATGTKPEVTVSPAVELTQALLGKLEGITSKKKGGYSRLFIKGTSKCVAWVHQRKDGIRVDARIQPEALPTEVRKRTEKGSGSFGVRVMVKTNADLSVAVMAVEKAVAAAAE